MPDLFDPVPSEDEAPHSVDQLEHEAEHCRRCPLYRNATQLVFGEGAGGAGIVLVGEQPGDQEDLTGRPFVGPAGRVLDQALAEARLDRQSLYVTNAVKHFKFEQRGKRRLHKSPNRGEITACRWWLDREIALIRPRLVVALGGSAAFALMHRTVVLARERGRLVTWAGGEAGLATIHPSAVLRQRGDDARRAAYAGLVADLTTAGALAEK